MLQTQHTWLARPGRTDLVQAQPILEGWVGLDQPRGEPRAVGLALMGEPCSRRAAPGRGGRALGLGIGVGPWSGRA